MARCKVTYHIGYERFGHDRLEIKSVEKVGINLSDYFGESAQEVQAERNFIRINEREN